MPQNSISTLITNAKECQALQWLTGNQTQITLRFNWPICKVALGRSQRPTGRLPAKPNFIEENTRAEKTI